MDEGDSRQAQRAERILEAASDLFAHYGYDKTTMEDIARAAGVSKGAIYLHFRGKEDLFDALIARESARKLAALGGSERTLRVARRRRPARARRSR